jgi:hypothetical protein
MVHAQYSPEGLTMPCCGFVTRAMVFMTAASSRHTDTIMSVTSEPPAFRKAWKHAAAGAPPQCSAHTQTHTHTRTHTHTLNKDAATTLLAATQLTRGAEKLQCVTAL